jgi:hypothetical protein
MNFDNLMTKAVLMIFHYQLWCCYTGNNQYYKKSNIIVDSVDDDMWVMRL